VPVKKLYKPSDFPMAQPLQPHYEGRVLMNASAAADPVVRATLDEMAKRNFQPQEINNWGVWYISDRD
jgi:hypothetical protein